METAHQVIIVNPEQFFEKLSHFFEKYIRPSQQIDTTTEKPLSVDGAREFLDYESDVTIYRAVAKKTIPFHRRGRKLYFFKSELNNWIKNGFGDASGEAAMQAENKFLLANAKRKRK